MTKPQAEVEFIALPAHPSITHRGRRSDPVSRRLPAVSAKPPSPVRPFGMDMRLRPRTSPPAQVSPKRVIFSKFSDFQRVFLLKYAGA